MRLRGPGCVGRRGWNRDTRRRDVGAAVVAGSTVGSAQLACCQWGHDHALLSYQVYHFPAVGFQMAVYMARLLRHGVGRSMAEVHTADMRARELVATRPQQPMTTVDFDHVAALGPATVTMPRRSNLATN